MTLMHIIMNTVRCTNRVRSKKTNGSAGIRYPASPGSRRNATTYSKMAVIETATYTGGIERTKEAIPSLAFLVNVETITAKSNAIQPTIPQTSIVAFLMISPNDGYPSTNVKNPGPYFIITGRKVIALITIVPARNFVTCFNGKPFSVRVFKMIMPKGMTIAPDVILQPTAIPRRIPAASGRERTTQ